MTQYKESFITRNIELQYGNYDGIYKICSNVVEKDEERQRDRETEREGVCERERDNERETEREIEGDRMCERESKKGRERGST